MIIDVSKIYGMINSSLGLFALCMHGSISHVFSIIFQGQILFDDLFAGQMAARQPNESRNANHEMTRVE